MMIRQFFLVSFLVSLWGGMSVNAGLFDGLIESESKKDAPIVRLALQGGDSLPLNQQELLYQVAKTHKLHDNFQYTEFHLQNLYNFVIRSRILSALEKDGDRRAQKLLREDKELAEIILEDAGIYSDEYNVSYVSYLKGIWPLVALFDSKERTDLITALKKGKLESGLLFLRDPDLLAFFQDMDRKEKPSVHRSKVKSKNGHLKPLGHGKSMKKVKKR